MFKRFRKYSKGAGGLSPHEVAYAERMRIQSALSHERNFLHMDVLMQNCAGLSSSAEPGNFDTEP